MRHATSAAGDVFLILPHRGVCYWFEATVFKPFLFVFQLVLLWLSVSAYADEPKRFGAPASVSNPTANPRQFLPAEQAFQLNSEQRGQELTLRFTITPQYYLYKERFRFQATSGNMILGQAFYSAAPDWKDDAEFGRVQVFHESLSITLPVKGAGQLEVFWQGCAEAGLCYPPQSQLITINAPTQAVTPVSTPAPVTPADTAALPSSKSTSNQEVSITIPALVPTVSYELADEQAPVSSTASPIVAPTQPAVSSPSTERIDAGLPTPDNANHFDLSQKPILALFTLWALGIGLAFTPCVLPMLPIVAGIVARQHARNARQGFTLAFAYGLGVASSYALLGALVSVFGSQANVSLWLQNPAILIGFSALFVVLALTSFDVFHLQLPVSWQQHLDKLSQRGKAGSLFGTWLMGFFSALVVSPCVSAPLAGVLLSVSTLGNPWMGACALFALGLGLSTPLMVLGASEGRFMPKAGIWLNRVKQSFGIMLLAIAIILLERVVSGSFILVLWSALSVGSGFWVNQWGGKWRLVWRGTAYMLLIWGAALLLGAALGSHNALQPLDVLRKPEVVTTVPNTTLPSNAQAVAVQAAAPTFKVIHSPAELDALVNAAYNNNQRVLVDFYADWCVSCKVIDREVFADAQVHQALQGWVLVRADITQNTVEGRALLKRFQLFGPPAILFFEQGLELSSARIVGEVSKDAFLQHLQQNFATTALK